MDISDINKVANRKRLTASAEKLREKISKENRNIIKLKVAQDTAYWDLKEQLRQTEGNHEKLQANMVDVQMQHEALSGQYQDELRLRPETLNKLGSTREICDVLEDYTERLRDTVSRCKADQAALYEAYTKSGQVVRDIKTQQIQADEKNKQIIENLNENVKMTSEHHSQVLHHFSAEKQKSDAALVEVNTKLSVALAKRDELIATGNDLTRKLDQCRHELKKKEEAVASLQSDIKRLIQEFTTRGTEIQNTMLKQQKELKEANAANESLKQALANQELFTKSVCEQNNQLQDKVAALEDSSSAAENLIKELNNQLEGVVEQNNNLKTEIATANDRNQTLENDINEKNQLLANADTEIQNLKLQLNTLEAEKLQVVDELAKAGQDTKAAEVKIQQLTTAGVEMEAKIAHIEVQLRECSEKADQKIEELSSTIASQEKELDAKASAIGQLMSDMKTGSDARARLERAVEAMSREMDLEREAVCDRERRMGKQIEDKDKELCNQMNIILELRGDKERLHEKIQHMQNKIDNIQKELTGSDNNSGRRERVQPEQDDNAVMLTPARAPAHKKSAPPTNAPAQPKFAVPRSDPKFDNMVLSLFSDNSMDGDKTVDQAGEVNRRFEALSRGARISPTPAGLAALKRRRSDSGPAAPAPAAAANQGGLRLKTSNNDDVISLSQVREDAMKAKERTFFKIKRQENKTKKFKQSF